MIICFLFLLEAIKIKICRTPEYHTLSNNVDMHNYSEASINNIQIQSPEANSSIKRGKCFANV
jgi:hypothetical protein